MDKAKRRSSEVHSSAGVAEWLSRWPRDHIKNEGLEKAMASEPVGLWARRGSSPFPGAILLVKARFLAMLDKEVRFGR